MFECCFRMLAVIRVSDFVVVGVCFYSRHCCAFQCLVPFSFVLADGADSIESLLKSAPDPPAVTPGGDHPEKSPPAQHPVSPGDQNSSSNAQLPGTPGASPGKEDVSKKGPLIQRDVSLRPQAPSSDKDSAGRDTQQGPEAKRGQGKQRAVKVSKTCQVS